MTFVPVMWTIWAVLFVLMAALYLYRSNLTKNEEDQIFLDESFDAEKAEQAAIVSQIAKVEPWLKVSQWLVAAMTVVVLVYYIRDILLQFHIIGS
jgi:Tfp pilus assembly protein PilN